MIYVTTRLNILFTPKLPDNTEQSLKSLKYALVFKKGLKVKKRGIMVPYSWKVITQRKKI